MNFLWLKIGLHTAGMFLKKHAPEILVGSGIAGFVGTVFLGCRATLKADDILTEKEEKLEKIEKSNELHMTESGARYSEEDYNNDKKILNVQTVWKLVKTYAPTVTLGAASVALILSGHGMLGKRLAASAAAYKALETGYAAYRDRVIDAIGPDEEKKLSQGLIVDKDSVKARMEMSEEELDKKKLDERKALPKYGENSFYFSKVTSSVYLDSDILANLGTIEKYRQWTEGRVRSNGFATYNDALFLLGMEDSMNDYGATHGWIDDGEHPVNVSFGIEWADDIQAVRAAIKEDPDRIRLVFNGEKEPIIGRISKVVKGKKRATKELYSLYRNRHIANGYA